MTASAYSAGTPATASTSLGEALGLDPRLFLAAIADGPLASEYAMTKGAAMLDAEFTPGFPLRHATKDVELALSAAHMHGVELPLTDALLPRWHRAIAADHGDDDVAAAVLEVQGVSPPLAAVAEDGDAGALESLPVDVFLRIQPHLTTP